MENFLLDVLGTFAFTAIMLAGFFASPAWQDSAASLRRLSKLPEPVRASLRRTSGIISNRDVANALANVAAERERALAAVPRQAIGGPEVNFLRAVIGFAVLAEVGSTLSHLGVESCSASGPNFPWGCGTARYLALLALIGLVGLVLAIRKLSRTQAADHSCSSN